MATVQNECLLPESIRCYLLRGNVMVPLVPADQLPFRLKGIPPHLSHRQMSDEGWKLFMETKATPLLLLTETPSTNNSPSHYSSGRPQYLAPDHHVRTESRTAQMALNCSAQPSLAIADIASERPDAQCARVVEQPSPLTDAVASIYPNDALRLGYTSNGPSIPRKVYCTHWIATGECRWTLTGCKYKHDMPGTEKLRELGFTRGTPKWWKEKNAVSPPKSLTWMQRQLARSDDGPQNVEIPLLRAFPDPSTLRTRRLEERSDDPGRQRQKKTAAPREGQPAASRLSLPVSPSMRTPPSSNLPQTPNLIDLDDCSLLSVNSTSTHFSSPESSKAPSLCEPCSEIFIFPLPSSSPLLPSSSSPPSNRNRKTNPAKLHRTRKILSSSFSSSSPESSSDTGSDTDAPTHTRTRTRRLQHRCKIPSHRNTAISTSPRPVENSKQAQQPQLGLANSKYAIQTAVSTTTAKVRQEKEGQAEQGVKKAHRKEWR